MDDMVKVRFALERDADGWPPAESEGLWAFPLADGRFRLDNTPWFAREVSTDDVVECTQDEDGIWWFVRSSEWGGHLTIRVIPLGDGGGVDDPLDEARAALVDVGATCERMDRPIRMLAVDIAPEVELAPIKALLVSREASGSWAYEEALISEEWRRLEV